MPKTNNQKKVVVAMSGGVDSSVAAALLKKAGLDVVGIFMKFWSEPDENGLIGALNRCCSPEAEVRARKVAKILKIPFYVLNLKKDFKKRVVDYFLNGYKKGITPNPCVVCNKEIKFGLLLEKALELDADFIATGHYARRKELTTNNLQLTTYKLLRAKDKNKDQSYFLWQLSQEQLKHILFPIGDYARKEVEKLAKKFKLPFSGVPKSMEICFIQTTINDFLVRHLKQKPGKIFCSNLKFEHSVIGEHQGLWFYTIGQRKGLGLAGGKPHYVLDKDIKKNILFVTNNVQDLDKKELVCKNVNWISGKKPELPLKIKAKIRYRHQLASATITYNLKLKTYNLKFKKPQRAITPGQSVVFYSPSQVFEKNLGGQGGEEVLGGGIIC